ncbi:MAG: hypothetical protein HGB12_03945 [Bacteroidetes bacterium]|nr:hypothetical protein [Bacteroidota bacterium]
MKNVRLLKKWFIIAVLFFVCVIGSTIIGVAQSPNIVIDGTNVYCSQSDLKFPFWLKAGQTIAKGTGVLSISAIEYTIAASPSGDNILLFVQVKNITTVEPVPAGKTWKVESVLLSTSFSSNSSGWTDEGTTVHLTTNTDKVGIGVTSPTAVLHLKAGTATSNTASFKIDAGTLLSSPEAGAIENDGTHIYWSKDNSNRYQLDQQNNGANTALSNLASVAINTSLLPASDNSIDLGSSSFYWANAYTKKIYFNASATINSVSTNSLSILGTNITLGSYSNIIIGDYSVFYPNTSLLTELGTTNRYWLKTYTQKLYLNSTAYLDGTTAGAIAITGNIGVGTAPGSALDVKGTLRLSGSSSGYVGLTTASAAGTTTYTLPNADGSNGQVLSTNGSANLSWTTPAGGFWTLMPGAPTRTSNTTFTITGDYTTLIAKGMIIKWTESSTVRVAMVSIPSTFSSPNTTVTIVGDAMASIDASSLKYGNIGAEPFIARFSYAGTVGATGTDVMNAFHAQEPMRVLGADMYAGTAGTTNSTTVNLVNATGTVTLSSPTLSSGVAATAAPQAPASSALSLALNDRIQVNVTAIQTTPAIDLYIKLYLFPTRYLNLN